MAGHCPQVGGQPNSGRDSWMLAESESASAIQVLVVMVDRMGGKALREGVSSGCAPDCLRLG